MNPQSQLTLTDNYGQTHKITSSPAQIGSASQCTIVLDELGMLDIHAEIFLQDNAWMLRDITGENSISVNGEKIQTMRKLSNRDVISIGRAVLRVSLKDMQPMPNSVPQTDPRSQIEIADLSSFRSAGRVYVPSEPIADQTTSKKSCRTCGQLIHPEAEICPHCGVRQIEPPRPVSAPVSIPKAGTRSKGAAAVLGIFLGGLGAHKFYLGQTGLGLFYLVISWTFIPAILGFFEGLYYLTLSDAQFMEKYG